MQRRVVLLALVLAVSLGPRQAAAGTPYIGEVRILGFNFCPVGWVAADGQLLSIAENDTLFNLYGTTYGGDGQETFAMPDLRGRIPIGGGSGAGLTSRTIGEMGGSEAVTLTLPQLPAHTHAAGASSQTANVVVPTATLRAPRVRTHFYRTGGAGDTLLAADSVAPAGGSQPVPNEPPFTAFRVCVSLFGVYPSQP